MHLLVYRVAKMKRKTEKKGGMKYRIKERWR
jgi:hypothetical protein